MLEAGLRNKIIMGVVVGVVLLLVVGFAVFHRSVPSCELVQFSGLHNLTTPTPNVASMDNRGLVNFRGYLEYELSDQTNRLDEKRFMPMELQGMHWWKENDSNLERYGIRMNFDCANFHIDIKRVVMQVPNYQVTDFKLNLVKWNGIHMNCSLAYPAMVTFPVGSHYACHQPISFYCIAENQAADLVAYLNMYNFEFEFNGDENLIKKSQFSQPAHSC